MSFGAGGIGDKSLSADKITDIGATRLGEYALYPSNRKIWIEQFGKAAIDAAVWTSTLTGAATNTSNTTGSMGNIFSETTATAGRAAKMNTVASMKLFTASSQLIEFLVKFTGIPSGAGVFGIGMSSAPGATMANNSVQLYYNMGTADWRFASKDNGGTVDKTSALTAPTDNLNLNIAFKIISGTSIECFINGVSQGTVSTNLPAAATSLYLYWYIGNGTDNVNYNIYVKQVRMTSDHS